MISSERVNHKSGDFCDVDIVITYLSNSLSDMNIKLSREIIENIFRILDIKQEIHNI